MENSAAINCNPSVKSPGGMEQRLSSPSYASAPVNLAGPKYNNSELLNALDGLAVLNMPLVHKRYAT